MACAVKERNMVWVRGDSGAVEGYKDVDCGCGLGGVLG